LRRQSQSLAVFRNESQPDQPLGSTDRSERIVLLRRAVFDALQAARDRHGGKLSSAYEALEPHATREGLTRDDFYRAARRGKVEEVPSSPG
jgi:hypothetical protein